MHEQLSSALSEKIEILTLVLDDETGNLAWAPSGACWASVKVDTYRNLFSAIGVGTRGATVIIRPHLRLTLHQAIRWRGEFLHLTSILLNREQDQQEIKAAICQNVTPSSDRPRCPEPPDQGGAGVLHLPGHSGGDVLPQRSG